MNKNYIEINERNTYYKIKENTLSFQLIQIETPFDMK